MTWQPYHDAQKVEPELAGRQIILEEIDTAPELGLRFKTRGDAESFYDGSLICHWPLIPTYIMDQASGGGAWGASSDVKRDDHCFVRAGSPSFRSS